MSRKEYHKDGSVTERFSNGNTVTRNSDKSVREKTTHETTHPVGIGAKLTVTRDRDGKITNVQKGWNDRR